MRNIETVNELIGFIVRKTKENLRIGFSFKFWNTFSKKKEVKNDKQDSGMVSEKEVANDTDRPVD